MLNILTMNITIFISINQFINISSYKKKPELAGIGRGVLNGRILIKSVL